MKEKLEGAQLTLTWEDILKLLLNNSSLKLKVMTLLGDYRRMPTC